MRTTQRGISRKMRDSNQFVDTPWVANDDIVTRLRGLVSVPQIGRPDILVQGIHICEEAANEIERLRAEPRVLELMVDNAIDEIKRLRADRDKWEKLAKERNPHSWRNLVGKRYGIEDMYE